MCISPPRPSERDVAAVLGTLADVIGVRIRVAGEIGVSFEIRLEWRPDVERGLGLKSS